MLTTESSFETGNASRYLQQLCKHFAHKTEVEFDETQGFVRFIMGQARMTAHKERLDIEASAAQADALAQVKSIIESHLVRFAFREDLSALNWSE